MRYLQSVCYSGNCFVAVKIIQDNNLLCCVFSRNTMSTRNYLHCNWQICTGAQIIRALSLKNLRAMYSGGIAK